MTSTRFPAAIPLFLLASAASLAAQDGGQLFTLNCSACHGADSRGATGGAFPPLAGSPWQDGAADRAIKITLHGLEGPVEVLGKIYNLEMPPQGAALADDQLAAILTYVRSSWGNKASAVTAAQVAKVRAATANFVEGQSVAGESEETALRRLLVRQEVMDGATLLLRALENTEG